jgi:hypothetical protein
MRGPAITSRHPFRLPSCCVILPLQESVCEALLPPRGVRRSAPSQEPLNLPILLPYSRPPPIPYDTTPDPIALSLPEDSALRTLLLTLHTRRSVSALRDLRYERLSADGMRLLADALAANTSVESLELGCSR